MQCFHSLGYLTPKSQGLHTEHRALRTSSTSPQSLLKVTETLERDAIPVGATCITPPQTPCRKLHLFPLLGDTVSDRLLLNLLQLQLHLLRIVSQIHTLGEMKEVGTKPPSKDTRTDSVPGWRGHQGKTRLRREDGADRYSGEPHRLESFLH